MPASLNGRSVLFGSLPNEGVVISRVTLQPDESVDVTPGFHHDSVEVWLNLEGPAAVEWPGCRLDFQRGSIGYFRVSQIPEVEASRNRPARLPVRAVRAAGHRHDFFRLTFSLAYLREQFEAHRRALNPGVQRTVFDASPIPFAGSQLEVHARPLRQRERDFCRSLNDPPDSVAASPFYFRAKTLEFLSIVFFAPEQKEDELFCLRQKRLAGERIEKVRSYLLGHLDEPLKLADLGRHTGCSPYYLSRLFSEVTGQTISQYLRRLRVEKAADLIASGRFNVGEAAIEVGYHSLSHFSKAFKEVKGCYPSEYSGG